MTGVTRYAVDRLRAFVGRTWGLSFEESKLAFLEEVLGRRAQESASSVGEYLDRLERGTSEGAELRRLVQALTVTETYFFRNGDQFRAFLEVALPDRMRAQSAHRRLRILSAGCASGEEPYSLAMLMRERFVDTSWSFSVRAVDVNGAALERAAAGRYSPWSLRETSPELQTRWFHPDGQSFVLAEEILRAVDFEERNLATEDPELYLPERYDIVFCRNVLMYFTPEIARVVVRNLGRALVSGGYLFLGHAETLRGLSQDFHLLHTHGTFYYQRRDASDEALSPPGPKPLPPVVFPAGLGAADESWVETIRRATERIESLASSSAAAAPSPGSTPSPRWDVGLGRALELLRRERFDDALVLLDELPQESLRDADVLLLKAVLLTHGGQLQRAELLCQELLRLDELNAGAHYLVALCREAQDDRACAVDHDQMAAYLDPAFAMPRLHLGLLARRRGDREAARQELAQALVLLGREDPSRVLLFGGGFSRDALVSLCQSELDACGGAP